MHGVLRVHADLDPGGGEDSNAAAEAEAEGQGEAEAGTVALRIHKQGDQGAKTLDELIDQARTLVNEPAGSSS